MSTTTARFTRISLLAMAVALGALVTGCKAGSGVGDPCTPENTPETGFVNSETYLETSSVQCRTRVCMVREFDGFPSGNPGDEDEIYCTCRCAAPEGSNTPACSCPNGFTCEEILQQGGSGIRGSYCVRTPGTGPTPDAGS